jgi:hypothetical protein
MISGTKISQLPVITTFQDTDYVPVQRGSTTNRASGLTLTNTALCAVKQAYPITYSSNTFTLSSQNIISLVGNQVNIQTNVLSSTGPQIIDVNSLSTALRITQTGSGNALVVEDSANPDSTPFTITSAGNVGVGTPTPTNKLHIHNTASTNATSAHIKLTQTTNSNESYIASDSTGFTRIGGVAGIGLVATPIGEVVSVLSAGKVGINTTTPNEVLTVSGNISATNNILASIVYANLSGNAETSSRWNTVRGIALSGEIYGNTSIDGTQDITIYTTLSTGVVTDNNISNSANISDTKLAQIVSQGKVSTTAIDTTGSISGQVLISTGSASVWQSLSSTEFSILSGTITNPMLGNEIVTEEKIADNAITTVKLSSDSVTTSKIVDSAITTTKILDGAVTLQKTTAYAAAIPNTLVNRDSAGNLSAIEVTANLKGNSSTASKLQNAKVLQLTGDAIGQVAFDGSENVTMEVTNTVLTLPPPWVVYTTVFNNLTGTYTQGTSTTESDQIIVTVQELSGMRIGDKFCEFQQDSSATISIVLTSFSEDLNTFLEYNLLTGTPLTATFSNEQAITGTYTSLPSGSYIVLDRLLEFPTPATATIYISSSIVQYASGNVNIKFDELFFNSTHKLETGHIVNAQFLTGVPLGSGSYVAQPSGLYVIQSIPNNVTSYTLSTNTLQSVSGNVILRFCRVDDNFKIPRVTYVDTGTHILNFETGFINPVYYGFAGTAILPPSLSGQPYTATIQRDIRLDVQDDKNLGIRTILNDGSLQFYDFYRNNIICFGNQN